MDIRVVMGESKPCSDLAKRLAMVYNLLLHRAEEAETGHGTEKQTSAGESLVATPARAGEKLDFDNRIAAPHASP